MTTLEIIVTELRRQHAERMEQEEASPVRGYKWYAADCDDPKEACLDGIFDLHALAVAIDSAAAALTAAE